jgi:hypothetical protein|tara:strand:- start:216 stop:725 length:510 start_codon:yes stop_codon:yes gene_type:complete
MELIKNYKPISAEWLESLTQFNTFITVTERGGMTSLEDLINKLVPFYKTNLPDSVVFTAFEPHANNIGYHAHSMAHIPDERITLLTANKKDGKPTYCRKLWHKLHQKFGRSSISAIKDQAHVATYCQKRVFDYSTKGNQSVYNLLFGTGPECRKAYLYARKDPIVYPIS